MSETKIVLYRLNCVILKSSKRNTSKFISFSQRIDIKTCIPFDPTELGEKQNLPTSENSSKQTLMENGFQEGCIQRYSRIETIKIRKYGLQKMKICMELPYKGGNVCQELIKLIQSATDIIWHEHIYPIHTPKDTG